MPQPRAVVLLSGGLDSATAAAQAIADGYRAIALSIDYGQRHRRELRAATAVAAHLGIEEHHTLAVNLAQWGASSLTDLGQTLPQEGVQSGVIPSTYVPGRNTVFIAVALALAEARQAAAIYLGINAVDYSGYPDCRPEYLAAFQQLAQLSSRAGLEGHAPQLIAPLVMDSKVDIVRRALALGVPIAATWSCYAGGEVPCGRCDSCRIRDRALIEAGCADLASLLGRKLTQQSDRE
jgi:7-cyano-7-deazaguanine synthase